MHSGHFIKDILKPPINILISSIYITLLSVLYNVVNYDSDNGWTTILDNFKKVKNEIPEISGDIKNIIESLSDYDFSKWSSNDLIKFAEDFSENCNGIDKDFEKFLSTVDTSGDLLEQYQQHLAESAESTSKFGAALKSLGAVAANIGISLAISAAITLITKLVTSYSEMVEKAQEATNTFKEQTSSIESSKQKITELRESIDSGNLSYSEATEKRQELLSIQRELLSSYGSEVEGIDLVNGSLEEQIVLLDEITEKDRQAWKNSVNELSNGSKIWNWWTSGSKEVLERTLDPFSNIKKGYKLFDNLRNGESFKDSLKTYLGYADTATELFGTNLDKITKKVENFKATFKATDNKYLNDLIKTFDGVSFDGKKFTIEGNVEDVSDTIYAIQTQLKDIPDYTYKIDSQLKDIYNDAQKIATESLETYKTAIQTEILDDDSAGGLKEYYMNLSEAYQQYQNSLVEGDESAIEKAKSSYSNIMESILSSGMDERYVDYFSGLYTELKSVVDDWNFETKITPNLEAFKNKQILKDFSIEELSEQFKEGGNNLSDFQKKELFSLNQMATECGMSLDSFLEKLKESGVAQSQIQKDFFDKVGFRDISNTNPVKQYLSGLEDEEYTLLLDAEIPESSKNWVESDWKAFIAKLNADCYLDMSSSIGSIEKYKSTVESITNSYSALQAVQSEQNSQNYITKESYDALIEANSDFANCLEYGNGHMEINMEKANALAKANSELALAELEVKEALEVEQYNKNWQAIQELISGKSSLTREEQEQVDALREENSKIEQNVQQYDLIESQIKQATSAYNEWQAAMNGPEEGDMYDSIVSNLDKVKELYDQGLTGTNAFKTATTALFGEDFNLDNFGTYFENIKRYFSEGSQGAQNFVDDLIKIGQLQVDNEGNYFGDVDWSKVQKELNLTYDDLQAIFGKLNDFNFDIDTTNGIDGINDLTEAQNDLNSSIEEYRKKIDNKKNAGLDTTQDEEKLKSLEAELEAVNTKLEDTVTNTENVSSTPVKLNIDAELDKLDLSNMSDEAQETLNQLNATNEQIKFNAQMGVDNTYLEQQAQLQLNLLKEQLKVPVETDTEKSQKSLSDLNSIGITTNDTLKNVQTGLLNIRGTNVGTAGLPGLNLQLDNANSKADQLKKTLGTMPYVGAGKSGNGKSESGTDQLNGTTGGFTHANGTAFINGSNISAKESSLALTGELGRELVVRGNRWFTTGDNGAEFTHIKKGDIVFNAEQTRQLLDGSGKINSRGRAFAQGTAYADNKTSVNGKINSNSSKTPTKSSPKKKSKESSKTLIDWIERRINVLTQKTERWANIIENATNPKRLDSYYKKLEENYKKQLKTYSDGATRYLKKANSIKLDSGLKNKVKSKDSSIFNKDGSMKSYKKLIKEYGEKTAKKIQDYQNYIDKYESAIDSFIETSQKLYQAPIEKAADKIELLTKSLDLLDAKLDNISIDDYKKANDNLEEQRKNAEAQLKANREAEQTAKSNYKSTKSAVTKKSNLEANDLAGNKNKRAASAKTIKDAVAKGEEIDLSLYKAGSSGYKAAVKYNAALKAQKDAIDAAALSQEEYTKTVRENAKAQFDNIQTYYESQVKLKDHQFTSIDNKISEIETAGKKVNKSYYESQKKLNKDKKKLYEEEKAKLEEQIANIPKGTEEWYDAKDAIQECANAISDCVKESYDLNNAINQLHFDLFDDVAESIDRIITEQEFLQGLFAHENLTDDKTGDFTGAGLAKLGSLSASYYAAKEKAERDAGLLKDLQNVRENGKQADGSYKLGDWEFNSLDDLQAKIDEVYTKWQDDIKETYNLESDIADLMKEKYQAELDMLQELIDAKKKALDAEKDLHDYQQSIQEKSKDITILQKQISAYSGDTSQEGLAKLQKLQVQLSEKENDLRETEYDRYISDQQDMLDKLYQEYEELMTKKLDDFYELVKEGLTTANEKTAVIESFLSGIATENGYKIETDGLFTIISGNINDSTKSIVDAIVKDKTEKSGTESEPTGNNTNNGNDNPPSKQDGSEENNPIKNNPIKTLNTSPTTVKLYEAVDQSKIKKQVEEVFANSKYYAKGKNKKASDYKTKINQVLFEKNGKVLSSDGLAQLRKIFNTTNDGIYQAMLDLSKAVGNIKNVGGFKKGGIAKLIKSKGEDGITFVRNGEGFIAPEHVQPIEELVDSAPQLNNAIDILRNVTPDLSSMIKPNLPNLQPVNSQPMTNNVEATYNFTLENCTNADDIIREIQHNQKVQKVLRSVTIDQTLGIGNLSVNKIK